MNRAIWRAAEAKRKRKNNNASVTTVPDRASLVRVVAAMAADDLSLTGATLTTPDGVITYLDAGLFRRGGSA